MPYRQRRARLSEFNPEAVATSRSDATPHGIVHCCIARHHSQIFRGAEGVRNHDRAMSDLTHAGAKLVARIGQLLGSATPQTSTPSQGSTLMVGPANGDGRSSAMFAAALKGLWRRKWTVSLSSATLLAAVYFGPTLVLGPRVPTIKPVRGLFVQSVVASGRVEAPFRVEVGTQITGVVVNVPVVEGQAVKAGDPLFVLDDREARAEVVQAEGVVAQAQAKLRQLRELTLPSSEQTLRQVQATLLNAHKAYERAAKLADDGYATTSALDEAIRNQDIAQTQVQMAQFQVFTSRPGGSDYVMAETQINQALASLETAQSRLTYTTVTAPRDGTLISRDVEVGNVVQAGKILMKLSPAGDTQLVVQIDEKNLSLIAIGQPAIASADAYAKETFPAEVFYINPGVDLLRASVEVKLRVPHPPDYLREDMTVSVDVEVARRADAVTVATGGVRGLATPEPWVMKIQSGRAHRQKIVIGIVSGGQTEVISGLVSTDEIIPENNTAIADGQRVRTGTASPSR
jgi:HlyD family secretion protein